MNIALITGASSGMGAELARLLSREGETDGFLLISRSEDRLQALASELDKPSNIIAIDITKREERDFLAQYLEKEQPNITYLINCAGVGHYGLFEETDCEKHINTVSLNCEALTAVTYLALPYMKKGARIVMLSSASAFLPQKKFSVYAASKAYVLSFSRALGAELKSRGISVTVACPGPVATDFMNTAYEGNIPAAKKKFCADCKDICEKIYKGAKKRKKVVVPTLSMKLVMIMSRIFPHSILMRFLK